MAKGTRSKRKATTPNVRNMVRSMLSARQELKRSNTTTALTAFTVAGVVIPISQRIPQADVIAGRSGDTISPRTLKMVLNLTASGTNYFGRVIIFQDMHNVGIDPTVAQLLDGGVFNSTYFPDPAQQRRFKVLYDHVHSLVTATHTAKIAKELTFKLKGKIFYNDTTNVTAANGPGAVYVLFISDVATGANTGYNYYTTLTYTDS